jgi:hypothetical protein
VDGSSLRALRILFGALMVVATLRFWWKGWIDSLFVAPSLHFHYFGFGWVNPLPGVGMYVVFGVMLASAIAITLGRWYRPAILTFFLTFTYAELCEKAAYLNHYYLVSLLALLLAFMPATSPCVPRWTLLALRTQLAIVYFYAGVAKLDADWLLRAEPLQLWLTARSDMLAAPAIAFVFAWAGALFDLSAPLFLFWRRTRGAFFVIVVVFHLLTAVLFPSLGLFPWIMIGCATIFLAPEWPRRWLRDLAPSTPRRSVPLAMLAVFFAIQLLVPLRFALYPGSPSLTDQGFRFAWRVMIVDKVGNVEFRVKERDGDRRWSVSPSEYLTALQTQALGQSPDMVLELARRIAEDFRTRGIEVEVYADAFVALNGRPSQRLIDPNVNLAAERDSLAPSPWILPK